MSRPGRPSMNRTREEILYQKAIRQREYRERKRREKYTSQPNKLLEVQCWCRLEVIRATRNEIRAGLTRSCGNPDCHM